MSWKNENTAEQPEEDKMDAYDAVGWDNLSPYAKSWIDQAAADDGITLHAGTDEETLRRYIRFYRGSW